MRLLKNRGVKVAPYKVGPDYIDPAFHEKACGRKSKNLDEFMLPKKEIKYLFHNSTKDADIHIVEGVMGLYDGYGNTIDYCSTASISKILDAKVILIIDAKSLAGSAAAMALGFKELDKSINIGGIIVNRVSTESHYALVKDAIEKYTNIPVIGRVPKNEEFSFSSRHLGLTPSCEVDSVDQKFELIAKILEEHIDIDKLLEISEDNKSLEYDNHRKIEKITDIKIALAKDKAFNFYYEDSLKLFEEMGVTFIPFSPLEDEKLPECQGVFLGGGFPEVFAKELSSNKSMLSSIKDFGENGGVIFGECGGLMYLGTSLIDSDENEYEMVNLLKGKSQMKNRLQRFGYCQGRPITDTPIAIKGEEIRGHEFHYSDFETNLEPVLKIEKFKDNKLVKSWKGGYKYKNVFGTYLHTHFCGKYKLAKNFIKKVEETIE